MGPEFVQGDGLDSDRAEPEKDHVGDAEVFVLPGVGFEARIEDDGRGADRVQRKHGAALQLGQPVMNRPWPATSPASPTGSTPHRQTAADQVTSAPCAPPLHDPTNIANNEAEIMRALGEAPLQGEDDQVRGHDA
ncbi:hypothetical protein [Streptomyces sp. NPDC002845]